MTTVYVLTMMAVSSALWQPKTVHIETAVFTTAARCLRNANDNEKRLKAMNKYTNIEVKCQSKELFEGK